MLTFKRSCTSALNAMLTVRGTSGNAPNCREESDISDRADGPGDSYLAGFAVVIGSESHTVLLQPSNL